MFDSSLPYTLVQIRRNKYNKLESYSTEYVFKFYRHNEKSCIKYLVSIKEYGQSFMTLDYYPKINLTPKKYSADCVQDLRYRMLTRQNSFGYIGGTILQIMYDLQKEIGIHVWGFLAANLLNETTNFNNKRFIVYKKILSRSYFENHKVFGNKDNSAIFVIPNNQVENKDLIISNYEQVFSETN